PHSQTWPPLSMNSRYRSASTGRPCCAIPSAPPSVPSHTAPPAQSTIDSCSAVPALFAAMNRDVPRSGSSFARLQLKITLSRMCCFPFHATQKPSVSGRLDRTNDVAQHPCERRQVLLRRGIPGAHHEHVADRDLLHVPPELAGEPVGAPQVARVEAVRPGG